MGGSPATPQFEIAAPEFEISPPTPKLRPEDQAQIDKAVRSVPLPRPDYMQTEHPLTDWFSGNEPTPVSSEAKEDQANLEQFRKEQRSTRQRPSPGELARGLASTAAEAFTAPTGGAVSTETGVGAETNLGLKELGTPGKRGTGVAHLANAGLQTLTPVMGPAAIEAGASLPSALKLASGFVTGAGASKVAGKVAPKLGANQEQTELAQDLAFWMPSVAASLSGFHGSAVNLPEVKGGTVGVRGAGAGVAVTPESVNIGGRVGPFRGSISIPRNGAAAVAPALEPPTIEGSQVDPSSQMLADHEVIQQRAARVANGQPPVEPPPAPPAPPKVTEITQDDIQHVAGLISKLPAELRAQGLLEAHQTMARILEANGKVISPSGKLIIIDSPKAAEKAAADMVNDEVDRQDKARQESAKAKPAAKEIEAEAPVKRPTRQQLQQVEAKAFEVSAPEPKFEVAAPEKAEVESGNATLPLSLEPNGQEGTSLPGAGQGNHEQLSGGVSGRTHGDHQPERTEEISPRVVGSSAAGQTGNEGGSNATPESKSGFQKGQQVRFSRDFPVRKGQNQEVSETIPQGTSAFIEHAGAHDSGSGFLRLRLADGRKISVNQRMVEAAPQGQVIGEPTAKPRTDQPLEHGFDFRPAEDVGQQVRDSVQKQEGALPRGQRRKIERTPEEHQTQELFGKARKELGEEATSDQVMARVDELKKSAPMKTGPGPKPGEVGTMKVSDLKMAPNKFQYKLGTDAEGVSSLLKEQDQYKPDLAGVVSVWRDPADGQMYVVNGHHRFELAKRTRQKEIAVRHIQAPDAKRARSIGALQNIAEGRGTPVDAAKFFRDSSVTPEDLKKEGISLGEQTAKNGMALSRLDTPLFNKVVSGDLRLGRAVAIGEATDDPAEQKAILSLVDKKEARGQKISDGVLSELIRFVKESGREKETTADLFGSQEITKSLALEKAEISDYIRQQLSKDRKLFGFVAKEGRAEDLARAGNKIDVDKSKEISTGAQQAEEVYNRLSARGGDIADILDQSAKRLAGKENAATVKSDAYTSIREAVRKALSGGEAAGTQGREAVSRSGGEPQEVASGTDHPDVPVTSPRKFKIGNRFAEKAIAARARYDKLSKPSAHDVAMERHFPLGVGFGRPGAERRMNASIDKAVDSVEARKNAEYLEAQAEAFDRGEINAQGRRVTPESQQRSENREAYQEKRQERVAAAKEQLKGKERWQVPAEVYADSTNNLGGPPRELVLSDHREYVEKALAEGKTVPAEVLKDYPDLTPSQEASADPTLPGMESVPAERAEANAEQQGKDLTAKLTEPPKSIESKAGEIEQKSPLFRDTEANPQESLFGAHEVPGPGAKNISTGKETKTSHLSDLTDAVSKTASTKATVAERMRVGSRIAESAGDAKDSLAHAYDRVKGAMAAAWDILRRPPEWDDFTALTGRWSGARQEANWELQKFSDAIKHSIPDKLKREAITNWIEADGDESTLRERAQGAKAPYKAAYEAALKLSDEEQTVARNIMNFHDAILEEAQKAGIVDEGVENYIQHIWDKTPEAARKVMAQINFAALRPNPAFAKQRKLPTYYEGEQLGFKPVNKDVGFLTTAHDRAFQDAIASRAYIKSLFDGKGKDGRPLATISRASAHEVGDETSAAYLIKPHVKPAEEYADYRMVDHPALRKWRWADNTEDGKQTFVQGDALIHPEIYQRVKNNLGTSAMRTWTVSIAGHEVHPGKAIMGVSWEAKRWILAFGGLFHQTTLGVHAMEHKVSPIFQEELHLNDPVQKGLVDHGLMVSDFNAMEAFGEGLGGGGGLVSKIPVLGPLQDAYQNYLFKSYMPRLKMAMAKAALERNRARYSDKLSDDQIQLMTANQANAAFGGLNLKMLGRNPTLQDVLRTVALAPDFLEARARFVGQGAKGYGREQLTAFLLGGLVLYTIARVLNEMLDKKPHWDKPFSLVYGDKEYSLRTVQGDVWHAATDVRGFLYSRLNPFARTGIELATGRDEQGRQRDLKAQLKDYAKENLPIPAQSFAKPSTDSNKERFIDALLRMTGINSKTFRTHAEEEAAKIARSKGSATHTAEDDARYWARRKAIEGIRKGDDTAFEDARAKHLITSAEARELHKRSRKSELEDKVRNFTEAEVRQVYEKSLSDDDPEETEKLARLMRHKRRERLMRHLERFDSSESELTNQ